MTYATVFQPTVTLREDRTMTVEWAASYTHTEEWDGQDMIEEVYDDPAGHVALMEAILGGPEVSPADKLRRLADHLDGADPRSEADG